jgi:prevent-host-death family protein
MDVCGRPKMEKIKMIGIAEVRPRLTQLVDEVSKGGQPYTIVSGSRAKAVLLGVDEYNALIEKLEDLEDVLEMNKASSVSEPRMSWKEHLNKSKTPETVPAKGST